MGLRAKILLCFGGLLTIVLLVIGFSSYVFARYSGATQDMLRHDFDSVLACQRMQAALELSDSVIEKSLLGSNADAEVELRKHLEEFNRALILQQASVNLPGEDVLTARIVADLSRYRPAAFDAVDPRHTVKEQAAVYTKQVVPASKTLHADLNLIYELNQNSGVSTQGQALVLAKNARSVLHVMAGLATVLAVLFALAIGRLVLRPLRQLMSTVQQIRQGNLDTSVTVSSRDELGQLAAAFNEMTTQLRELRRIDRERIARSERTTQLAIDSLPDPVLVVSPAGRLELTNLAARHWFNFEPGKRVTELEAPWLTTALSQSRTVGASALTDYEAVIRTQHEGGEQFLLPRVVDILDENQRLVGVTVVLNDVTGLRRLDQMKSGLLALVSHELKTPLTSVRMALHLLVDTPIASLTPELRDLLNAARDDSDRLARIVESLLDMGRIESGRVLMDLRTVDLAEMLRASIAPLERSYSEAAVTLKLDVPVDLPPVQADATRVGYAISNLLGNALRYTSPGGTVSLSARDEGEFVLVQVSDTGAGISAAHLPRIFEKFYRVPGQPSDGGAGLGLAIVKDIVEAHGGRVGVDSKPGYGTTFRFTLRAVTREADLHLATAVA